MGEEKKGSQLIIRIPVELRDRFKKVTTLKDTTMGEAIREFIEGYVSEYEKPRLQKKRVRVKKKKEGVNSAETKKAENSEE